jgi:YfiH family protein
VTPGAAEGWPEVLLGSEHALKGGSGDVTCLFGLGPAYGGGAAQSRADAILANLGPAVRALRWGEQVHGKVIATLSDETSRRLSGAACVGRCDGLMTAEDGVAVMVWTADCVPVLLSAAGVVAAVHCGWRGAAAGIITAAVRRMWLEYGVDPKQLRAWVGPAIGPCHYPVGAEVRAALAATGIAPGAWQLAESVDLRAFAVAELVECGAEPDRVTQIGSCTACETHLASFRRDGEHAGRQFSLVFRSAAP